MSLIFNTNTIKSFQLRFIVLIFSGFCLSDLAIGAPQCSYIMGWESWEPYQFFDSEKNPAGLDIEIVESVFKAMGCDLSLKHMPWKRVLKETEFGNIHLLSGASMTPARKKWGYYTDAYRKETVSLFILKGQYQQHPISGLADITHSNYKLGVTTGHYYGAEFEALMKNPAFSEHIKEVHEESLNAKKLLSGRVDGYFADTVSATYILRRLNILDQVEIHPLEKNSTDIHVIFSKKNITLETVEEFNKGLSAIKSNGLYQKIMDKY